MGNKLASIVALTAALTPALANAIGFGEIALHSRIGEPLMAEVPIVSNSSETPIAACFSMVALRGADFPVVTAAKPRLIKRGSSYILQIVGERPVNEPVFAIGVRANCGYDFERQYVLMPEPPIELAQAATSANTGTAARPVGKASQWQAREGETLEAIAEARAPNNPAERRRLLAALKRANPELESDAPLAEGTLVQMPPPQRKRPAPPPKAAADTPAASAGQAEPKPPRQPAPPSRQPKPTATPPTTNGGTDRLVLGAAGEPPQAKAAGNSGLTSLAETEERLLKLETTLHRLTQEIEKMDQAIDLATKALEAQSRLQMAQNMQPSPAAPAPRIETQSAAAKPAASSNWLELLISAAIGAGLSIGMAQFLGRRRRYPGDEEVPLAFSGYRSEATPSQPPKSAEPPTLAPHPEPPAGRANETPPPRKAAPAPQTVEECDIPLQLEADVIEAKSEDEHSVLELAEIMLAFGRLRGAAETLAEHIDQTMPKSFEPWNMLLDLYRRGGMRQEFEALALKMRARFNARIPDWNESSTPVSGLKTLEDFPHVIQQACQLWGSQACVDYLYGLVHDTRAGQRSGFPLEVVEEIALLMRVLVDGYDLQRRH